MNLGAIIAAGGIGSRMQAGSSKQLLMLAGQPVVARSAAIFQTAPAVVEIVIVIGAADVESCRHDVVERYGLDKVKVVASGGDHRSISVQNGIAELSDDVDTVLIHDGARPLFTSEMLAGGLRDFNTDDCDGVIFGIPVTDTIKQVGEYTKLVETTPERSRLWSAQTPQIFRRGILEKAFQAPAEVLAVVTDDASLVERAGGRVKMTMGSPENIKITTPMDIIVAEEILRQRGIKNES